MCATAISPETIVLGLDGHRRPCKAVSEIIGPLKLDRLTVADDSDWLDTIDGEQNLPDWLAPRLRELY